MNKFDKQVIIACDFVVKKDMHVGSVFFQLSSLE